MTRRAITSALSLSLGLALIGQSDAQGVTRRGVTDSADSRQMFFCEVQRWSEQTVFSTQYLPPRLVGGRLVYPTMRLTLPQVGLGISTYARRRPLQLTIRPDAPGAKPSQAVPTVPSAADAARAAAVNALRNSYTITESPRKNVSRGLQWQSFSNSLSLSKPGQDQLPLTLTLKNGDGGPPFSQLRLILSGRVIGSEKSFRDNVHSVNISGLLGTGDHQFLIQGFGPPGAALTWKVTAPRPSVKSAEPIQVAPGKTITIRGENFSTNKAVDEVSIGGQPMTLSKPPSVSEITAIVPENVPCGEQTLTVKVAGREAQPPVKVQVTQALELTAIDMISAPPGQTVTIKGKGFSTKSGENQVMFGGVTAQILSISPVSISCIVPEMESPQWNVPVTVITNKVKSKGSININLQRRAIENTGVSEL